MRVAGLIPARNKHLFELQLVVPGLCVSEFKYLQTYIMMQKKKTGKELKQKLLAIIAPIYSHPIYLEWAIIT